MPVKIVTSPPGSTRTVDALVRAEAADLDVGGEADAEVAALLAQLRLLLRAAAA